MGTQVSKETSNQLCLDQEWYLSWAFRAHVRAFPLEKGGVSGEDKDPSVWHVKEHGAVKWQLISNPTAVSFWDYL